MIFMKLSWLVLEGLLIWFFLYFGSGPALALAVLMLLVPLFPCQSICTCESSLASKLRQL